MTTNITTLPEELKNEQESITFLRRKSINLLNEVNGMQVSLNRKIRDHFNHNATFEVKPE